MKLGTKQIKILASVLCLLAVLALPAFAEGEKGEANITPQTTMKQLRENPAIKGSGLYTFGGFDTDLAQMRQYFENDTLAQYFDKNSAVPCAKALNLVVENFNRGVQVTYPLYTAEEILAQPSRAKADLYYFPAETPGGRYAIVLGGTAASTSGELREGLATAWELHQMGYTTFVLRYRTWVDSSDDAPMEDLARAIAYITDHAEEFGVQAENYAMIGYSTGGHLEGLFASETSGYYHPELPQPAALLLAYPINDFAEFKPVYRVLMDFGTVKPRYYTKRISDCITPNYPATYHWRGRDDLTLMLMGTWEQGPEIEKALEANNVPHKYVVYNNAPHASSTGLNTDANGWLYDAVDFWEQQLQ